MNANVNAIVNVNVIVKTRECDCERERECDGTVCCIFSSRTVVSSAGRVMFVFVSFLR